MNRGYYSTRRYLIIGKVTLDNGTQTTTCPAAMGYSFAAGTTDGPGAFDFIQVPDVQNCTFFLMWRLGGADLATIHATVDRGRIKAMIFGISSPDS